MCLTKVREVCAEWQQRFKCPTTEGVPQKICRRGMSFETPQGESTEGAGQDLNEALSKLSILGEIQKDLKASGASAVIPSIFKGQGRSCTIAFAGFKNCCGSAGGWGVDLGLGDCSGEEKDLSDRRNKGFCHEVGTYCAERVLGICTRKKRSFCCFPSKLSRLLHEQGRAQLGLEWGEADSPECRGFTDSEIARLNFDQLDLREVFDEVSAKVRLQATRVVQRNLETRISQMTEGFKNKPQGETL
jgi:hypothetical protein